MKEEPKILFVEDALSALREGEEKFRLAVENSPIPVMIHDEDGRVLMLSKGWTQYSGYDIRDIPTVGDWTQAAYGRANGPEREYIDGMIRSGWTQEKGEWRIRTKDGETRIWEFYSASLGRVSEGKRVMQSIAVDVTDSRKMQEMLTRERDRAEETDRLKTAFLHNISHEIRTPMNAIIGFTSLMAEPGQSDEVRASYSEIIMNSCNQLIDVVSDIIEIANIEAGILKYRNDSFNINSQMASLHRQYQVRAAEKNIIFNYVTSVDEEEALIETDHSKFVTIMTSLLNNAFKFTQNGSVEMGCKKEAGHLVFHVTDTGIGIPEEEHQRIFERFYQVEHSATRNYEGAGLGLSISKAYAEFLGGRIWVESTPGKGSRFIVVLPLARADVMNQEPGINIPGQNTNSVFKREILADDEAEAGKRRMVI